MLGKYLKMSSLFWEEISACATVHMRYVMDVCDRVWHIILLPPMMGTPFVLVALTTLVVSKAKHQETWSYRTCINFPFLRGEKSNTLVFLLNGIISNSFYLWCKLHLKNQEFLFRFERFFEETKWSLSYWISFLMRNLIGVCDG